MFVYYLHGLTQFDNSASFIKRGIKYDFPFINVHKVSREVLKTEGKAQGFQSSRGTLRMLMNDKIMFDRFIA